MFALRMHAEVQNGVCVVPRLPSGRVKFKRVTIESVTVKWRESLVHDTILFCSGVERGYNECGCHAYVYLHGLGQPHEAVRYYGVLAIYSVEASYDAEWG